MKKLIFSLIFGLNINLYCQNNALSFSGSTFSGANVMLNYNSALNFAVGDKFSIECWAKTTASYAAVIWSNHVDVAPFSGHEMAIVNGKPVMDMTENYISAGLRAEANILVNDGNWHHLAFIYKGIPNLSGCEIYVDGVSQPLTANPNNLMSTSTTTVINEVNIGSRDNTTYFSNLTIDELRIWKRVLCAAEIQANKNCSLVGNEPQLEAYYKFNQGIPAGINTTVTTLLDSSPNAHTGTLTSFALNGTGSNWIASTASVSGNCSIFSQGMSATGSSTLCRGMSSSLSASGASSYTWQPGNIVSSSVIVSPTITTTYTIYATNASSCLLVNTFSINVLECTGLEFSTASDNQLLIYPNPNNGTFNIEFGVDGRKTIELIDVLGRKLKAIDTEDTTIVVKMNDLPQGIYLVYVKTQRGIIERTIVIEE
ncbi:MAG: T9SS type A sorting domain-containing protein [Bacteroidetes bacterium]|nr:T9SS type A sorting domain-containing protein [Bacteroidota bacterium]